MPSNETVVEEDDTATPDNSTEEAEEKIVEDDGAEFIELNDELLDTAERVNWDGEIVDVDEGTWLDQKAFNIGDTEVTVETVVKLSAGVIIAIVVGSLVFLYITWRKRKAIAAGARRASTIIVR